MIIRKERPEDRPAIQDVVLAAFENQDVADLVDVLRDSGDLSLSLVAEIDNTIVGHVAASPVAIDHSDEAHWLQLSPLSVHPVHQRKGIGAGLVLKLLEKTAKAGGRGIVLLGAPKYYKRFGFQPASYFGLEWEKGKDKVFQAVRLSAHVVPSGTVKFHSAFDEV